MSNIPFYSKHNSLLVYLMGIRKFDENWEKMEWRNTNIIGTEKKMKTELENRSRKQQGKQKTETETRSRKQMQKTAENKK